MKFYAFGLNHETASLKVRAPFAFSDAGRERVYRAVKLSPEAEFVLLTTCNRTEVYLYGMPEDVGQITHVLEEVAKVQWPDAQTFLVEDEEAVRHVIQVTAGLRSQVLGDRQIFAQVKEAYREAIEAGSVRAIMHRLMHAAFRAARRVLNETNLSPVEASVAHLAIALAKARGIYQAPIVVLGAGEMARNVLEGARELSPEQIVLLNRTPEKAQALAERYSRIQVAPWEERYTYVAMNPLTIVATGALHPVLRADALPAHARQALLVDLAIPRNIDPAIEERQDYEVYDLDRLKASRLRLHKYEAPEIQTAERICEEQLEDFVTWYFHQQALQPAIQTLRDTFEQIRLQEIERHAHRFKSVDREELDVLTRSIMQKLLAIPVVRLKDVVSDSLSLAQRISLLNELFSRPDCEENTSFSSVESREQGES